MLILFGDEGLASVSRQTDNGEFVTVLRGVPVGIDTDKMGQQIAPPWARPGTDEAAGLYLSNKFLYLGGPDENPDYEPQPGDTIEVNGYTGFNGTYRQVADTAGGPGLGLDYWKLPAVRVVAKR